MSAREALLDEAKATVLGSRTQQYAPPDRDFHNIANIWSVILGTNVSSAQVALCMIALKISRLMHSPSHSDSWTDIAGYAACGFEVTQFVDNVMAVDPQETEDIRAKVWKGEKVVWP